MERLHPKKENLVCQNQSHRAHYKFRMKQCRLKQTKANPEKGFGIRCIDFV